MKYILYPIFLLFILTNSESKTRIEIFDSESGEPISYARFVILKAMNSKDTLVSQMTNKTGTAVVDCNLPFLISVNHTGYEKFAKTINTEEDCKILLNRKVFVLDEIVTTGQFTPQSSQKSVYKINAISEERIVAQSAFNLRELMMTEMNIRVSQDNILGSSMSINGLSGQNVKIMIDGVPVVGRLNGNIDLSQINLNNARRVEIVEGPMSAIYGTDALGGVVNIITKDVVEDSYFINGNSFYESVGIYNFDGIVGYNFGRNNIIASGGRNFFDGFSEIDTSRFKRWKPKEQYFGDVQLNHFGDNFSIRYQGQYFNEYILNRGMPRAPYRETAFDDHYKTLRLTNTLSMKGEVAKNRFYDIIANYSTFTRTKNTYFKDLVTLNERMTADPADQDTNTFDNWMLRAVYSHDNILKSVSYQAGIDLHLSTAAGRRIDLREREVGDYALFGSLQASVFDNLILQPSVRFIHNTKYEAPVVPSLNIKYDLNSKWSFRGSYAKGFRAPSLQELHFMFVDINHNILGNTDLKAETSDSYILGINYHSTSEMHSFKIESGLFYNNVKDLISLANIEGDLYSYINIGEFHTMGGNIALSYIRENINSRIGFSYTGRQYRSSGLIGSTEVIFTPEVMTNLIYNLPFWDLRLNAFYKFTGRLVGFFAVSDVEYDQFEIGDFHTMDMSLSRDFIDKMITFTLGIRNLFDVTEVDRIGSTGGFHADGSATNPVAWGRTFSASFRFNIK
ncbi:MAG: TonB-dependent receptor [Candidatus Kapabacteria bacterium]|nr:TonB-dependent receptor [Ignavibacteriota bacterium]MCW5883944.1 TonB-dependent receptor [Candidatus Kapabacteria bacterium]